MGMQEGQRSLAEAEEMPSAGRIRARRDKGNLWGKLLMKYIACE